MKNLLIEAVENLEEEKALYLAKKMISSGTPKEDVIAAVQVAMDGVGKLYEKGEYFIADLMMAGILFREILTLEDMHDGEHSESFDKGLLMLATVEGDLHDIGKDLFGGMAEASGFRVMDLGVDVKLSAIVENVRKYRPDILGLSAVLMHASKTVKEVIAALEAENLRKDIKIIVGGSAFQNVKPCDVRADFMTFDASDGLKQIKEWATGN